MQITDTPAPVLNYAVVMDGYTRDHVEGGRALPGLYTRAAAIELVEARNDSPFRNAASPAWHAEYVGD